jgi:hypothetical protein
VGVEGWIATVGDEYALLPTVAVSVQPRGLRGAQQVDRSRSVASVLPSKSMSKGSGSGMVVQWPASHEGLLLSSTNRTC